ncbi:hypothetical protein TSOC_013475, partial [Tetrabaena socialis]
MTEKERELALLDFRRSAFGAPPAAGSAAIVEAAAAAAAAAPPPPGAAAASPISSAPAGSAGPAAHHQAREAGAAAAVLVLTDVCLKALPKDQLPVGVSLVVEFELPPTKEVYLRRLSALFGGGKDRRAQRCV